MLGVEPRVPNLIHQNSFVTNNILYGRRDLNPHTPITLLMTVYKTVAIHPHIFLLIEGPVINLKPDNSQNQSI